MQAAAPFGDDYDQYAASDLLHTESVGDRDVFRPAIGVDGLGEKGAMFFAHFTAAVTGFPTASDEDLVATELCKSQLNVYSVLFLLQGPAPHDLITLRAGITSAWVSIQSAQSILDQPETQLGENVNAKKLKKQMQTAYLSLIAASHKIDKLIDKNKTNDKSMIKPMEHARDEVDLAIGMLFGFQGKTGKQLRKTLSVVP